MLLGKVLILPGPWSPCLKNVSTPIVLESLGYVKLSLISEYTLGCLYETCFSIHRMSPLMGKTILRKIITFYNFCHLSWWHIFSNCMSGSDTVFNPQSFIAKCLLITLILSIRQLRLRLKSCQRLFNCKKQNQNTQVNRL